jgi:arsenate reductase-like glutaredoxin family protein
VGERVAADKTRIGRDDALKLLKGVERLVAVKGKKVVEFDLKRDEPDEETLLGCLMGPTGNLRAPTARVGKTLIVGFNEETYRRILEGQPPV